VGSTSYHLALIVSGNSKHGYVKVREQLIVSSMLCTPKT